MFKNFLYKRLLMALACGCLVMATASPALAAGTKPTPVVPGMDRRIPGKVESAKPGTPWAKTRTYTPPAYNEPTIKAPAKQPIKPPTENSRNK